MQVCSLGSLHGSKNKLGIHSDSTPGSGYVTAFHRASGQPGLRLSMISLLSQGTAHPQNQKSLCAKGCFKTPVWPPQDSSSKYCPLPVTIRTIWKCFSQKIHLFCCNRGVNASQSLLAPGAVRSAFTVPPLHKKRPQWASSKDQLWKGVSHIRLMHALGTAQLLHQGSGVWGDKSQVLFVNDKAIISLVLHRKKKILQQRFKQGSLGRQRNS